MSQGSQSVGHPVDVATGTMFTSYKDFSVDGRFELFWERYYSTVLAAANRTGPFGPGWVSNHHMSLTRTQDGYYMVDAQGSRIAFPDPGGTVETGGIIRNLGSYHELRKRGYDYVVTRWTAESIDIESYVFRGVVKGKAWPLVAIEDTLGHGLDLAYNREGLLLGIKQKLEGLAVLAESNALGLIMGLVLTGTSGAREQIMRYEYDRRGRLITAIDALGQANRYEYDDNGLMIRELSKDGAVFSFKYDDVGRCTRVSGLGNYDAKSLRYMEHIGFTEVTDSTGAVSRYQYHPSGQVYMQMGPLGGQRLTEYDEHGRITKRVNEVGSEIKFAYDEFGNRAETIDADGSAQKTVFNEAHLPLSVVDKMGNEWKWEYDAANRLTAEIDPLGLREDFAYDQRSNIISIKSAGLELRQTYTLSGRLHTKSDWDGNLTTFEQDEFGRTLRQTGPNGATVVFNHDALGRMVSMTFPDGTARTWKYNPMGVVTEEVDPAGNTTRYSIGTCQRLLTRIDPLGHKVKYVWGTEPGRLLKVINELGEEYKFKHDLAGRVIYEKGFDGREMWFEYDLAGQMKAAKLSDKEIFRYERDALGRIVKTTLPDGLEHAFAFNAAGEVVGAENPGCKVEITRDAYGRAVRMTQNAHTVESVYTPTGIRAGFKTSLGLETAFELDSNGRVGTLKVNGTSVLKYKRDQFGQETGTLFAGHIGVGQTYDPLGNLRGQKVFAGAMMTEDGNWKMGDPFQDNVPALFRRAFQYGKSGNLETMRESLWGESRYAYDPADRLIRAARDQGPEELFDYDAARNPVRISRGATDVRLKYIRGSRIETQGGTQFAFDAQGRMVRKTVGDAAGGIREWKFEWDYLDQLSKTVDPDGREWTYAYDAFGRRISKQGPDSVLEYLWDDDKVIQVIRGGKVESTWLYAEDGEHRPIYGEVEGKGYAVITDQLGTARELIDDSGNLAWASSFTAWGETLASTGTVQCPLRAPGQWYDQETGFHYNRYRYYDPSRGQFLTSDPISLDGGTNLYSGVPNPLNYTDVNGLSASSQGNSKNSHKKQHVYEIHDNQTGKTHKFGISGRPLNQDGSSPRANTQVNRLNDGQPLINGRPRFEARIVKQDITSGGGKTSRQHALDLEQKKVNQFAKKNGCQGPPGNTRPQPTGPCP